MAVTYASKLTSPLWQKRRLEIFNRDNFKCTKCKATHLELQVHHFEYIGNIDPWEYPDDLLTTLCVECHQLEKGRPVLESNLATAFRMQAFLYGDLVALSTLLHGDHKFTNSLLKILRRYAEKND